LFIFFHMVTKEELEKQIRNCFTDKYEIASGYVIPEIDDIQLGNYGKELDLAMLFIDIKESTKIVDAFRRETAVKMYKSFLWGVAQIARGNGGELRSFNGDGVLVVFIGSSKCTNAVRAGLQMSWFVKEILKPRIQGYFRENKKLFGLNFDIGIGVDVGKILVVRGGIRGENNNDLVWVGNATNYAVKLSSLAKPSVLGFLSNTTEDLRVCISEEVYKRINKSIKFRSGNFFIKMPMWNKFTWKDRNIYKNKFMLPI